MAVRFRGLTPNKRKGDKKRPRSIRQVVRYDDVLDGTRRYVTDDPSPEKMANLLRSVDEGDIAALTELTDEMIGKDLHLKGVSDTRRGAITSLDWAVEPNPDDEDIVMAEAKAKYVQERLMMIDVRTADRLGDFSDALDHLSGAIGPNVAVWELLWDRAELSGVVLVPGHRLTGDPFQQRPGVFVETDTSLGVPAAPGKWVVHHPQANGGFPFRSTLTQATVYPWMMIHFGRTDWMAFTELYGNPLRIAKWTDEVVDADRSTVLEMLERMGSDAAGGFPVGIDVELLQASGKGEAFIDQIEYAERKMSIGWLGQSLTTDTGQSGGGAFALGKIHEGVRSDVLAKDLKAERGTIESQLIAPMVALKFPDHPGPTPAWTRKLEDKRDLDQERMNLDQLKAAQEMGLPIKRSEVYETLSFEEPAEGDTDVIGPAATGAGGVADGG